MAPPSRNASDQADLIAYVQRVLIAIGIAGITFLLWQVKHALVLAFASVIVAVILLAAARGLRRLVPMPPRIALGAAIVLILAAFALASTLIGAQIATQVVRLIDQVPQALASIEQQFGVDIPGIGEPSVAGAAQPRPDGLPVLGQMIRQAAATGISVMNSLAAMLLAAIAGIFLAARPEQYQRGVVLLFPRSQHARVEQALRASGRALYLWLLSQLVAMLIIGLLVACGTWLIGLPAPLALGLFAGIMEFVPILGPVLGAIPAVVLALQENTALFLWTVLLFVAIQLLESNIVMPVIGRQLVRIPPVLLLFSIFVVGLLFGAPGLLVAAPFTVVVYVLIKTLYIRDTLGEETRIPGEQAAEGEDGRPRQAWSQSKGPDRLERPGP